MESWQFKIPSSRVVVYRSTFIETPKQNDNENNTVGKGGTTTHVMDTTDDTDTKHNTTPTSTTSATAAVSKSSNETKKRAKTTSDNNKDKQSIQGTNTSNVVWRNIDDHHFNNQIELFIPWSTPSSSLSLSTTRQQQGTAAAAAKKTPTLANLPLTLEDVHLSLSTLMTKSGHYRITCSLVELFKAEFITRFIRHGIL
jgi:hypothetical protein